MPSARTAERNELILSNAHLTHADISRLVFHSLGEYVTPNAVNIVITRAKTAGDTRVARKTNRRGRKSASTFNDWVPTRRNPKSRPRQRAQALPPASNENLSTDIHTEVLPPTARPFLKAKDGHCRFPLRGAGISMIVCGDKITSQDTSYCEACRRRAYLQL